MIIVVYDAHLAKVHASCACVWQLSEAITWQAITPDIRLIAGPVEQISSHGLIR